MNSITATVDTRLLEAAEGVLLASTRKSWFSSHGYCLFCEYRQGPPGERDADGLIPHHDDDCPIPAFEAALDATFGEANMAN